MTTTSKSADIGLCTSNTGTPAVSATVDVAIRIKRALVQDLRECRLSRAEVALQLSSGCGRTISEAQIDSYTAETKTHRIPIELVPAWVGVTGSRRLLDLLCGEAGLFVATAKERDLAEFGRQQILKEKAERSLQAVKEKLWHEV